MEAATQPEKGVPEVSIVVVTWNNVEVIRDCLQRVFEQEATRVEAIVCDNGSSDATVATIEADFPQATVIKTGANWGFAPAVNLGLRHARGRWVMLLNPEGYLSAGVLRRLIDILEANPRAGAAGPRIVESGGEVQPSAARRFPSAWRAFAQQIGARPILERLGQGEALAGSLGDAVVSVPCLSGAAMMIPRTVFESVGDLDETLPMYLEDIDFCARLGQAGLDLLYVPAAVVTHEGGHSSSRSPSRDLLYALSSGQAPWTFQRRFHGAWAAGRYAAALGAGSLLRLSLLAPLLAALKVSRRSSDRVANVSHRAWVLLRWSIQSKSGFSTKVGTVFDPVGAPRAGAGGPIQR